MVDPNPLTFGDYLGTSSAAEMTTEEWAAQVTPDQCERIIERAMAVKDFPGVMAALRLLTTKDPQRAADVLNVINAGLNAATRRHQAEEAARG